MRQLDIFSLLKKFHVLGVGARPPGFNIVDTQFVELVGDRDLVDELEADLLGLGTISQRSIVDYDSIFFLFSLYHGLPLSFI